MKSEYVVQEEWLSKEIILSKLLIVMLQVEWARKKSDWYDPFIEITDDLLEDVDKTTLIVKKKPSHILGSM